MREAGLKVVTQLQNTDPNFQISSSNFDQSDIDDLTTGKNSKGNDKISLESKIKTITDKNHNTKAQQQTTSTLNRYSPGYYTTSPIITALGKKRISTKNMADMKPLTILHYNDVYNIESNTNSEPVGGAARFCTAIKSFQNLDPLVLFSGDAFSPSMC